MTGGAANRGPIIARILGDFDARLYALERGEVYGSEGAHRHALA